MRVLEHATELCADDVGVDERTEVRVRCRHGDRRRRRDIFGGDDRRGGLLLRDLEREIGAGCHGDPFPVDLQLLTDDLAHACAGALLDTLHEGDDERTGGDELAHDAEVLAPTADGTER